MCANVWACECEESGLGKRAGLRHLPPPSTHHPQGVKSRWDTCRTKNPGFLRQPDFVLVLRRRQLLKGLRIAPQIRKDGGQNGGAQAAPGGREARSTEGGSPRPGDSKDSPSCLRLRFRRTRGSWPTRNRVGCLGKKEGDLRSRPVLKVWHGGGGCLGAFSEKSGWVPPPRPPYLSNEPFLRNAIEKQGARSAP